MSGKGHCISSRASYGCIDASTGSTLCYDSLGRRIELLGCTCGCGGDVGAALPTPLAISSGRGLATTVGVLVTLRYATLDSVGVLVGVIFCTVLHNSRLAAHSAVLVDLLVS